MNYSSKVDVYNKQVHGIEKKDYSELVERLMLINSGSLGRARLVVRTYYADRGISA